MVTERGAQIAASVPFALIGGLWPLFALDHAASVASAVGFIALAGVAAEFGVVMLIYIKHTWERRLAAGGMVTAPLLSMFVIPAAFLLLRRRELRKKSQQQLSINLQMKGEAK